MEKNLFKKKSTLPGVMTHACNASAQGHSGIRSEILSQEKG
jgi:hypothetical protein